LTQAGNDPSKVGLAVREFNKAVELMPDIDSNPEILFWYAMSLGAAGRIDEALGLFRRIFALDENWRTLVPRLARAGLIPNDPALISLITSA